MANIKSQKKRILTNEKARKRNRAVRSELKTVTREVHEAVEANNGADAYAAAVKACRLMDKAVSKGVIHKRQAANRKSGIMNLANTIVTESDIKAYKAPEKSAPVSKGGTKKAAVKAERVKEMEAASQEKAKRRAQTVKDQEAASKKKAAQAKEEEKAAAAAEAEAGTDTDETEENAAE